MESKSQFSNQALFEISDDPSDSVFSPTVEASVVTAFVRQVREFGNLFITFLKLYFQGRILILQNHILSFKLQMWEVVFLYLRVQIFLTRLAHGCPVGQCWPRK